MELLNSMTQFRNQGVPLSESNLAKELTASLKRHSALPYLFIGSGLSRRYLGLPDWTGLLRYFAELIGEDFDFHKADANGDLTQVAASLARAFHPIWWKDSRFEEQRETYKSVTATRESAFKIAVASYFEENSVLESGTPGCDIDAYRAELSMLQKATIDGVITTNYDSLTDQIFPEFTSYIGQDELLLSDAQFIAETYKIHGSQEQPESLVITHSDYTKYAKRNHYLAAKLLTIFAEHPVIFLGYSLTDDYIREIIDNIAAAVGPQRIDELGKRIYFVEWNDNPSTSPTLQPSSIGLTEGSSLPIQRVETHDFLPVFESLASLERPFSAKILRELRKYVFDLVIHPDPEQNRETVIAVPFDSEHPNDNSDLRIVFGVGSFSEKDLADLSSITGRALTREDLARDVLGIRTRGFDAENVLKYGLEQVLKSGNGYVPVYKYLNEAGRIDENGNVDFTDLPSCVKDATERIPNANANNKLRFDRDLLGTAVTPHAVMEADFALYFRLDSLLCLKPSLFEIDELREVLASRFDDVDIQDATNRTYLYKAICHYDRLRYMNCIQG